MALEGLLQFEQADRDLQPELLVDVTWESVRGFFKDLGKMLEMQWFEK